MHESRYQRLKRLDLTHVWHPFTQMRGWQDEDILIIERGEGDLIYDTEGRDYIDGISSLWVTVHGHNRPEINQAIKKQVDLICHSTLLGQGSPPSIELASRLADVVPQGLTRTFYSDAGSTATEIGLKIAFQYWRQVGQPQRSRLAALNLAYHGDTIGAVSVGGMDLFHAVYRPLLFDAVRLPSPYCFRCELEQKPESCNLACAAKAEEILDREGEGLAGLIIEPLVQGAAGMVTQPEGYLTRVAEACRRNRVLLIADEVAVGFGRTGKMFACEHENIRPDILCLGKGISGGYLPLAATMATEEVFEGFLGEFDEFKTFFHGHTYTGNPVACSAALASLDLFETDRTMEKLGPKIQRMTQGLEKIKKLEHVGQVRQCGFMVGIELVADKASRLAYAPGRRMGHQVILKAREMGVVIRPLGDVVILMPMLSITPEHLDRLLEVTEQSIILATEK